jgi:hypothetical protein
MKKLLVAAIMVVLATPAFAAIQNVKVSGDITESYLTDNSLGLGFTGTTGNPTGMAKQSVFLSQVRLRVDADLSDNVSTTVGLINERAWNAENDGSLTSNSSPDNLDTNVQLYLASITMRELLYSPLTVTVGRQVFNYGNGLILGDGGPVNSATGNLGNIYADLTERTAYDGVKAILDYKPLTIDLIYFKNQQDLTSIKGSWQSNLDESSNVFGYNANYQLSDPWNTVVEQYMFARVDGAGLVGVTNEDKGDTLFVPGLRASTNPVKGLNVQGEVAWQLGNKDVAPAGYGPDTEHRDAMAAQLMASYALPVLQKYKPTVNASYTYVSGDKNSVEDENVPQGVKTSKVYTAWDEFNTIQGAGTIYRALLPLSNENILAVGASVNPLEDVTVGATWSSLWAASRISAQNPLVIIQPNGSAALGATSASTTVGTKNNDYGLGNEADINLTYNYTEDVTFGASVGWFVPGSVFSNNNRDTASQAIANVAVKF